MPPLEYMRRSPEARVLLVSQRVVAPVTWRCLLFNFEDAIAEMDAADIAGPVRVPGRPTWLDRLQRGPVRGGPARRAPSPGRRYSLLFVGLQGLPDLDHLAPLSQWLDLAELSVCYVEELWQSELRERGRELELLRRFDLVLLSCHDSVDPVAAATGRPCRYLPPAIDMLTFCPFPDPPARVIDVYAMGRRSEEMHRAIARIAARRRLFYLFDTLSDGGVHEPAEHRRQLARVIQRTRYFLAMPPKFDVPAVSRAQQEVGFRYFEGAAAGTVLFGAAPDTPVFSRLFDWPDAVVPCAPEDVGAVLDALDADPARVEQIRRRNVAHSLRRHDCAHRWAEVLGATGLPIPPGLEARRRRLAELLASIGPDAPAPDAEEPAAAIGPAGGPGERGA